MTNTVERGNAVVIASDSFAIDDAGDAWARAQTGQRIDKTGSTGTCITWCRISPGLVV
jgi:hypothetical protein